MAMGRAVLGALLIVCCAAVGPAPAPAGVESTVELLPPTLDESTATAINTAGDVVGFSFFCCERGEQGSCGAEARRRRSSASTSRAA
jgi:hypothetical protein